MLLDEEGEEFSKAERIMEAFSLCGDLVGNDPTGDGVVPTLFVVTWMLFFLDKSEEAAVDGWGMMDWALRE